MGTGAIVLTPEQHAALLQAQQVLQEIGVQLQHLTSCGVDCQQIRKDYQDEVTRVNNLLRHFTPPPS